MGAPKWTQSISLWRLPYAKPNHTPRYRKPQKLAKQAKALHPGLSHAQRLNLMAQHHLQARSYHEVRKWIARSLEQHYERKDSGVVYCKLCRFLSSPV